ncbi:MAG: sterol desaturase family protein, partial [Alphaproteobacteria bacterium]|nr:sterol desaturase family protein [Alphaproteobacteria bacterium]
MDDIAFLRLALFLAVLAAMAVWESAAPRRPLARPRAWRWTNNLGLVALDTLLVRLLVPLGAAGTAAWAEGNGIGLLPVLGIGGVPALILALLVLDLSIWAQHVAFHKAPILWRLHRLHHADVDFDASTALRFHPIEILLSVLYKMLVVTLLGAPVWAVVVFEIALNAGAMFNHGNVRIPAALDGLLRLVLVTPDMHRVHHSIDRGETDNNYGFNLSLWDRLLGTYRAAPAAGHEAMILGQPAFR